MLAPFWFDEAAAEETFFLPDIRMEMPELLIPGRKPVGRVVIDWDHPITDGLAAVYKINEHGGDPRNDITGNGGARLFLTGSPVWAGEGVDTTPSTSHFNTSAGDMINLNRFEYTYLSVLFGKQVTSGNPGHWREGTSSTGTYFCIEQGANGLPWMRVNGSDVIKPSSGIAQPSNGASLYSTHSSSGSEVWFNGSLAHSGSGGGQSAGNIKIRYIGYQNSSSERIFGLRKFEVFWNRKLSRAEASSITANPYQFLIPA